MAIRVAKPRSIESDKSTCSQPVALPFFISQMNVFLFPVGVCFASTLHSGHSPWLVVLTAPRLGWVNFWEAFLGARPTCYRGSTEEQSGVLVILVPGKAAERLGSHENIDAWIKTFCERGDPEKRVIHKTSPSFVRWSWSVLLLHLTISDLNHSLLLMSVPFLCLKSLLSVNQSIGSESIVREKISSAAVQGLKEIKT